MKAVKETVRKYYKYIEQAYVQPILTSDTGDTLSVSAVGWNNSAYYAFDGNLNTRLGSQQITQYPCVYLNFLNPVTLTKVTCVNRHYNWDIFGFVQFAVSGIDDSNNKVVLGTSPIVTPVDGQEVECSLSSSQKFKKIEIQFACSAYNGYQAAVKEIYMTGSEFVPVESTAEDYDFYEDIATYKTTEKTERKYYKYEYDTWVQPVLTENGTMGGNTYACAALSEGFSSYAYQAFDNSLTTNWYTPNGGVPNWVTFYSPKDLMVSNIEIYVNNDSNTIRQIYMQGSNDNVNWTEIGSGLNTSTSPPFTLSIDCDNTNTYRYFRIYVASVNVAPYSYCTIANVTFTAIERTTVEATSSDYDFYIDKTAYYAFKP